jgi:ribosome biogenesis GTPase / thiamine phosphate phosphatase
MPKGIVIQATGANYLVECEDKVLLCSLSGKHRIKKIRTTNPIIVGDIVEVEIYNNNEGYIIKIYERKSELSRKSTNLSKREQTLAVNIDLAIFFFTLKNPVTTLIFLDRFLAICEYNKVEAIIVANKIDIYNEEEMKLLDEILDIYKKIGYITTKCSVQENINLDEIKKIIKDKSSYIVGLSGTGKSSFINAIVPESNLKTGDISKIHLSGKHTTTFARLISLPFGGNIIDSPGIKAIGVIDMKKETMSHYFKEFFEIAENCKYYNCQHINEPECAVKDALENGQIAETRYKSYLNLMFDENNKHRK